MTGPTVSNAWLAKTLQVSPETVEDLAVAFPRAFPDGRAVPGILVGQLIRRMAEACIDDDARAAVMVEISKAFISAIDPLN